MIRDVFPANCTCCLLSSGNKIFIHSPNKRKKKNKKQIKKKKIKKLNIYKYFVCLILTLKNVQFCSSFRCRVFVSVLPPTFVFLITRPLFPEWAVSLSRWRLPLFSYKIDNRTDRAVYLASVLTSSGVTVAVLRWGLFHNPSLPPSEYKRRQMELIRCSRSSLGQIINVSSWWTF